MDSGMLVKVHLEALRAQADAWRQGQAARPLPRMHATARVRLAVGSRLVRTGLRIGTGSLEAAVMPCRPEGG